MVTRRKALVNAGDITHIFYYLTYCT